MANVLAYRKGMLRVRKEYSTKKEIAELPHSCDSWVIGDKKQAQALVNDLINFIEGTYEGEDDYNEEDWF